MPFAATWMEIETLILSEVRERERQIPYDITYTWNLIYCTSEPFHRKETHGCGEQPCGCQGEVGGSLGLIDEKQLHSEWISNEILLHSTGNYIQSPVMEHDGG